MAVLWLNRPLDFIGCGTCRGLSIYCHGYKLWKLNPSLITVLKVISIGRNKSKKNKTIWVCFSNRGMLDCQLFVSMRCNDITERNLIVLILIIDWRSCITLSTVWPEWDLMLLTWGRFGKNMLTKAAECVLSLIHLSSCYSKSFLSICQFFSLLLEGGGGGAAAATRGYSFLWNSNWWYK